MTKFEKGMIDYINHHLVFISFIVVTMLGILIRIQLRHQVSYDARNFLLPWYEEILENGIRSQVGNYNFPYQFAIFIMTKLVYVDSILWYAFFEK